MIDFNINDFIHLVLIVAILLHMIGTAQLESMIRDLQDEIRSKR